MSRSASRLGFALGFAAVAGVAAVGLTASNLWLAARAQHAAAEARLELLTARVSTVLERYAAETRAVLSLLEASSAAGRGGLDALVLLDRSGRVLSADPWPERAGLPAPELPGSGWAVAPLRSAEGTRLGLLLRHDTPGDRRAAAWVGGRVLDERFLDRVAAGEPAALFDFGAGSRAPLVVQGRERLDLGPLYDLARSSVPGRSLEAEREWVVARAGLPGAAGEELGAVLLAVEVPALAIPLGSASRLASVVGVAAALAAGAVGAWLARRIRRPVDDLVRAVEAVAAGQSDYTFPHRTRGDLEMLRQSFSRMQRALDGERERAVAAERVAVWREVARHVAHEVKNPLVPIRLTVENLLRARAGEPAQFAAAFEAGARTILEEVEQLTRLVREFSEFARLPPPVPQPVDVDDLVDSVLELYAAEPGLDIVRDRANGPIVLPLDRDQMSRALKNLVGNAVEALRESPAAARRIEVRTAADAEGIEISIADAGPGFPPEAVARAFEPYFTTRSGGTGLGLAIAGRIVVSHGGRIRAGNRAGGGAEVVVRLPRSPS